jgi:hypothetical protein
MRARCGVAAVALAVAGCLDAPPTGVAVDAGELDAAPPVCAPGLAVRPVRAFNASTSSPGDACEIDGALEEGGSEAGLDRFAGGPDCEPLSDDTTEYGGCGCVAVDFGAALPLQTITVKARWTPDACGMECVTACDEGRTMDVWVGNDLDSYRFLNHTGLAGDLLLDYEMPTGGAVRIVVVCRDWFGDDAADVAVDSIGGTCGE